MKKDAHGEMRRGRLQTRGSLAKINLDSSHTLVAAPTIRVGTTEGGRRQPAASLPSNK